MSILPGTAAASLFFFVVLLWCIESRKIFRYCALFAPFFRRVMEFYRYLCAAGSRRERELCLSFCANFEYVSPKIAPPVHV